VSEVLEDALAVYGPVAASHGVAIRLNEEGPPSASVDGTSAMIILTSLLGLAARAVPRGGEVELSAELVQDVVVFRLNVPGLSLPHTRLDRLDPPESADGLDAERLQVLSVCFAIARRHGGRVDFENRKDGLGIVFDCPAVFDCSAPGPASVG
jgi:hypothetical protein